MRFRLTMKATTIAASPKGMQQKQNIQTAASRYVSGGGSWITTPCVPMGTTVAYNMQNILKQIKSTHTILRYAGIYFVSVFYRLLFAMFFMFCCCFKFVFVLQSTTFSFYSYQKYRKDRNIKKYLPSWWQVWK